MEGENASGYRGEKERETEAEGDSAVETVVISRLFGESVHFFHQIFNGSRNRNEALKATQLSMM